MIFLSIDPGVHRVGCALWRFEPEYGTGGDRRHYTVQSELLRAELVEAERYLKHAEAAGHMACRVRQWLNEHWLAGDHPDIVVVEYPRKYGRTRGGDTSGDRADPNDLIDLAGSACAVAAVCGGDIRQTFPADWKGQVPKDVMRDRILRALSTEEEKALILTGVKDKDHNTVDAVGIGLAFAGRLSKEWIPR